MTDACQWMVREISPSMEIVERGFVPGPSEPIRGMEVEFGGRVLIVTSCRQTGKSFGGHWEVFAFDSKCVIDAIEMTQDRCWTCGKPVTREPNGPGFQDERSGHEYCSTECLERKDQEHGEYLPLDGEG